jgi:hypothetical protein
MLPVAHETVIARQGLKMRTRDLAKAMVDNPRMPVRLVEMAIEDASSQPSINDTPELMQSRMIQLDAYLWGTYKEAQKDASDPSLGEELRVNQQTNARALGTFLRDLGVPQKLQRRDNMLPSDYVEAPSEVKIPIYPPRGMGITQSQWDNLNPAEKAKVVSLIDRLKEPDDGTQ